MTCGFYATANLLSCAFKQKLLRISLSCLSYVCPVNTVTTELITEATTSAASADRTARPSLVFGVSDTIFQVSAQMQIKTGVLSAVQ